MRRSRKKSQKQYAPKVTLAPLSFERAIEGLLGVKPKPRPKKGAGKKKG